MNCHSMILGNCLGVFQGVYNGLPQLCFCQQENIWFKQIEIGHGVEAFNGTKQFPAIHQVA